MSEFHVELVTIGSIEPHPNADRLALTHVHGYPVVIAKDSFTTGQQAIYIPVDAVIPNTPEFEAIYKYTSKGRIKAAKLRGIFSMGVLHDASAYLQQHHLTPVEFYGITKYEPPAEVVMGGGTLLDDGKLPKYTDIEGYRRYSHILTPGEPVYITEKLHGACARFGWIGTTFYIGSKNQRLDPNGPSAWARVARELDLAERMRPCSEIIFFGELLGVQDLKYGHENGKLGLRFFDMLDLDRGCYCSTLLLTLTLDLMGLEMVPELFRGPWNEDLLSYSEGPSTLAPHVREGIVIKPATERWSEEIGRVILKLAGEGYHLRKES